MNENYTSSGLNNTTTRYSSGPKVPIFDGTVSAHFRPWLIQFEAIARHQCWTSGEKSGTPGGIADRSGSEPDDSPIDFLVDPGAVVSVLVAAGSINTPLTELDLELEAANKSDMKIYGMCSFELVVHGLLISMDTVVVDLNCQAILGMDILGDATKLPFILDLVEGTLSGGATRQYSYTGFTQQQNASLKR